MALQPLADQNQPGRDLLSRLYFLDSKGQLDGSSATEIVSNIVAFGFIQASATCDQGFIVDQEVKLECNDAAKAAAVRSNPNCTYCLQQVAAMLADRNNLEQQATARNPNYEPQVASPDVLQSIQGSLPDQTDGACKYVCLQCIAKNIDQNIQMSITENCNVSTQAFLTAFDNGLNSAAQQALKQNQDKLVQNGITIATDPDLARAAIHMTDTIKGITSIQTLEKLKQFALVAQAIQIDPLSTSVVLQNVRQAISLTMMASMSAKVYTDSEVKAKINYDGLSGEIAKDFEAVDLIQSLEQSIETIQDALSNTAVRLALILIIILVIVVLLFASIFFFRPAILFGGLTEQDFSK